MPKRSVSAVRNCIARSPWMGSRRGATPRASSRTDLPVAAHHVFEAGQLLDPDRTAGVQAAGRDANLGAHAELAAIGELGRGVAHHDCAVDLREKALSRRV